MGCPPDHTGRPYRSTAIRNTATLTNLFSWKFAARLLLLWRTFTLTLSFSAPFCFRVLSLYATWWTDRRRDGRTDGQDPYANAAFYDSRINDMIYKLSSDECRCLHLVNVNNHKRCSFSRRILSCWAKWWLIWRVTLFFVEQCFGISENTINYNKRQWFFETKYAWLIKVRRCQSSRYSGVRFWALLTLQTLWWDQQD